MSDVIGNYVPSLPFVFEERPLFDLGVEDAAVSIEREDDHSAYFEQLHERIGGYVDK